MRFFKKYINFTFFIPNLLPLGMGGGGQEISLPYRCYIPNLVKIGPVVLERKMLTDDGRHPIAVGYLSDSGDHTLPQNSINIALGDYFDSVAVLKSTLFTKNYLINTRRRLMTFSAGFFQRNIV